MQRNQVKKNFSFDNNEVMSFLQNRENCSIERMNENIGEELCMKAKLYQESPEKELKSTNLTPKKTKKQKMPEKKKVEKILKCGYDRKSLIDYAKELKTHYFDFKDSSNSVKNNIFTEKIIRSEKRKCGYFSNIIERSIEEANLRDEYLYYLGCQITPDLNSKTIFSKSHPKGKENNAKKGNFEKETSDDKCTWDRECPHISYRESPDKYCNSFKNMALNNKMEADFELTKCEENTTSENIFLNYTDNSAKYGKEESKQDYSSLNQKNKSSLIRNSIDSPDLSDYLTDISKLMNQFNLKKEFLLNYLDSKNACEIEGRDSDLNFFKVSNADFFKHLNRIDLDIDNSYYKLAKYFSSEIVHFIIPSFILISTTNYNDEQEEYNLNKVKAYWKFSIERKEDELRYHSLNLDQIQIYL